LHDSSLAFNTAPPGAWVTSNTQSSPDVAEGGCSQADLRSTGGDGLFYCFATN